MTFVTDASVVATWVLPDEDAVLAEIALDRPDMEIAKVPDIFWHELRNLLLTAERRGRLDVMPMPQLPDCAVFPSTPKATQTTGR